MQPPFSISSIQSCIASLALIRASFDCVAHGDAAGEVGKDNSVGAFTTIHESRISYGPSFHIQTSYDLWDFEDDILIVFVPV